MWARASPKLPMCKPHSIPLWDGIGNKEHWLMLRIGRDRTPSENECHLRLDFLGSQLEELSFMDLGCSRSVREAHDGTSDLLY